MKHAPPSRRFTALSGLTGGFVGAFLAIAVYVLADVGLSSLGAALPYLLLFGLYAAVGPGLFAGLVAGLLMDLFADHLPRRGPVRLMSWALAYVPSLMAAALLVNFLGWSRISSKDLDELLKATFIPLLMAAIAFFFEGMRSGWWRDRPEVEAGLSAGTRDVSSDPIQAHAESPPDSPSELGLPKIALLIGLGGPILLSTFFWYVNRPTPRAVLSDEMFDAIQIGMSLREVERVIGAPGERSGGYEQTLPRNAGDKKRYYWRDRDFERNDYSFDIYFENGVAVRKERSIPAGSYDTAPVATQVRSGDAAARQAALEALVANHPDQGGAETADILVLGLADPVERVRLNAAWSVRTIAGNHRAHQDGGRSLPYDWPSHAGLRAAILDSVDDSSPQVSEIAIRALVDLYQPAPDIRDAFVRTYATAELDQRIDLVQAMGLQGYDDAEIHRLLEEARQDPNPAMRSTAARATVRCKVPGAQALLEEMLRVEQDPNERESIESAILLIDLQTLGLRDCNGAVTHDALADARRDQSPARRSAAARASLLCHGPYAEEMLEEMLRVERDPNTRKDIEQAIRSIDDPADR